MQAAPPRVTIITILSSLLLLASACGAEPKPISQVTPIPEGVEVVSITEAETATSEITQRKAFNQCDSASPFKAQIQFSDSSSQANQQALVLKVGAGGEVGISQVAKLKLEGALEQHFSSSITRGQAHQEAVVIEVPPYTQQEYTIVWRETRRTGAVQYRESGTSRTANYSYRIGLELVSATGKDMPCPGQATVPTKLTPIERSTDVTPSSYTPKPQPTDTPTMVVPTATPAPPPAPTPLADTPPGTILEVGQTWHQRGAEVTLRDPSPHTYWVGFQTKVGLSFKLNFTNRKPQDISIGYSAENSFTASDNRGSYLKFSDVWPGVDASPCGQQDRIVQTGQTINLGCRDYSLILVYADVSNPAVTEVIFTVSDISSINNARWRIPIYH